MSNAAHTTKDHNPAQLHESMTIRVRIRPPDGHTSGAIVTSTTQDTHASPRTAH